MRPRFSLSIPSRTFAGFALVVLTGTVKTAMLPWLVLGWRRRFGSLNRQKPQGDLKARTNRSLSVAPHGDECLRVVKPRVRRSPTMRAKRPRRSAKPRLGRAT